MTDKVLDQLYNSADWLQPKLTPNSELPPEYYFDSFWSAPPEETWAYTIGQKHSQPSPASHGQPDQNMAPTSMPTSEPNQNPTDAPNAESLPHTSTAINAAHQSTQSTKLKYVNMPESPAFQESKWQRCINGYMSYCSYIQPPPQPHYNILHLSTPYQQLSISSKQPSS